MSFPILAAPLSARALLRWQFGRAHELLDATVGRLSAEAIHRRPPGAAAPVGARYAQAVLCEDLSVNGALASGKPLALVAWRGRTGLSELPSLCGPTDWDAWARRAQLNLDQFHPYAQAVYAATDAYLAALPDDALTLGDGEQLARLLSALLLTLAMWRGEIMCLLASER